MHRAVGLLLALALAAGRAYRPAPVSFDRPDQLGNAVTTFGTRQVGARACDERAEAKQTFGGFDRTGPGLIPVQRVTAHARSGGAFRAGVHEGLLGAVAGAAIGEAERARRLRLPLRDTASGQVDTAELAL